MSRTSDPSPKVAALRTLILGLARLLDSTSVVGLIETKFNDYFKADILILAREECLTLTFKPDPRP